VNSDAQTEKGVMTASASTAPIVVGIDGSRAAIDAALCAADEAVSRDVLSRLVHAVPIEGDVDADLDEDPAEVAKDWPETEYGKVALRVAAAAVVDAGKAVSLETEILWGEADLMLIEESAHATMVCLGSTGFSQVCLQTVGSTAATVAAQAHSSVAVLRTRQSTQTTEPDWIVTIVDDTPQNQAVVDFALDEAHLRRAPVLALGGTNRDHRGIGLDELDRRVASWRTQRAAVRVYPVAVPANMLRFLTEHDELSVQLAVLAADDATHAPAIIGPHRPTRRRHSRCSVLVVR
jgi:nucleotide-binding universal stress UspA family protein